jgi:hypothetical protein
VLADPAWQEYMIDKYGTADIYGEKKGVTQSDLDKATVISESEFENVYSITDLSDLHLLRNVESIETAAFRNTPIKKVSLGEKMILSGTS